MRGKEHTWCGEEPRFACGVPTVPIQRLCRPLLGFGFRTGFEGFTFAKPAQMICLCNINESSTTPYN